MPTSTTPSVAKEKSRLTKEEWKEYTKTVWSIANVSHADHPAVFPEEIPKRLIKLFTFWGETVLDPFGGVGTTAAVALGLGRNAVSIDQNSTYNNIARKRCAAALAQGEAKVRIEKGDARNLEGIRTESISLVVTSPPYWDKADYGASATNIGKRDAYVSFLDKMQEVYQQCHRVLEPGRKICIVTANVNQFTEHGLLTFPIAADTCRILRDIGFVMVNEVVWSKDKTGGRWGSANNQRPIFGSYPFPPNFLFKNVHEHILIFAKPNGELRTGEKVRNYRALMGLDTVRINGKHSDKAPPSRALRVGRQRKKR